MSGVQFEWRKHILSNMVNLKKIWVHEVYYESDARKNYFYHTFMNPMTAPHTYEFKILCSRIEKYIDEYLEKTRWRLLVPGNVLDFKAITELGNCGANVIKTVFKNFKSRHCECCRHRKKSFDSAHTILNRGGVMGLALEALEVGEMHSTEVLRRFVKLHAKYPVVTLCKKCHLAMNKIDKRLMNSGNERLTFGIT